MSFSFTPIKFWDFFKKDEVSPNIVELKKLVGKWDGERNPLNIEQVIKIMTLLQKERPFVYLTGSSALILSGLLPERPIGDLDLIMREPSFNKQIRSLFDPRINSGYFQHNSAQEKSYTGILGKYSASIIVTQRNTIDTKFFQGINCQDPKVILDIKKEWMRDKDKEDLLAIARNTLHGLGD